MTPEYPFACINKKLLLAVLVAGMTVSGCSSPSSDSSDAGGNTPDGDNTGTPATVTVQRVSLTGLAVDPYIANAVICADLNLNSTCDNDEPSTITSDTGEFDLGEWPDGFTEVQVLIENKGSWQVPQYGLHDGKPYGMPLTVVVSQDVEVESEESDVPPALMTPATTLQANYALTEEQILVLINQFSAQIGREITADDLQQDPVALYGDTPVSELEESDLAVFRSYLAMYTVNRILTSLQSLDDTLDEQFANRLGDNSSPEYQVLELTLDSIARATATDILVASQNQIDAGQQQMDDAIEQGALDAGAPESYIPSILAAVPDFPDLTAEVVMAVGVSIIEFELNRTQTLVSTLFDAGDQTFEQIAQAAADQLEADFTDGGVGKLMEEHIEILGVRIYGLVNQDHFLDYQGNTYYNGNVNGDDIYSGIVTSSSDLILGVECQSAGFFGYETDTGVDSRCTSALPTDLQERLADFTGSATPPQDDEDSPVDQNVWDYLPVKTIRVSDQSPESTCNVSGKVYYTPQGETDAVPAAGVPLYLNYGAADQEINVITDTDGSFEFARIPAKKYQADGWSEEEANGDDMYFFGVIAGKRRPVPAYYEYEANADYHFYCRNQFAGINAGNAGTGVPGTQDPDELIDDVIYAANEVLYYPLVKPLVAGTKITGTIDSAMLGESFGMEIHAKLAKYDGETSSDSVGDGGWIMDAVNYGDDHAFTSLDTDTGTFEITELAGGDYGLRPHFRVAGINDSGEAADLMVECDDTVGFSVPAGVTTDVTVELAALAVDEISNCYYAEGKSGLYEQKMVITITP
ncbi:hypothetical protein [Thalassolituus marinus]|uniref:Prealbumin-like fold domain-containing protein n=1 Tax=Thalassolituus marinus TaxID=671053 RepID=A0ABS7ZR69_9GAMM|nr:hypothetical protein [Thalassolituus marinus]MCA6063668.1 hypothetical protein [Thalassolituus marinus]